MKAHTPHERSFRISACTIARNESANIARSIESYRDFVDEVVVVDTGSTDDTAQIARDMGARVVSFEWNGNFAAARNFALDQVSGDWVVFLDADEYFSKNAGRQVERCIDIACRKGDNLIGCKWVNLDTDNPDHKLPIGFVVRILKAGVRYQYRIHEEAVPEEGKKILFVEKSRFFLYHTGYSSRISRSKAERNLPLLLQEMAEETDDRRRQVDHSYLSDCYYALRDFEKCRDASEKYIQFSRGQGITMLGNAAKPYLNLLTSLAELHAPLEEQEKWAGNFVTDFPTLPDAQFVAAKLQLRWHRLLTAEQKIRDTIQSAAAYQGAEPCQLCASPEEGHYALGQALALQGRTSDAMLSFFQAWRIQRTYGVAAAALLGLIRDTPAESQDAFVRKMFDNPDPARRRTVLWGLMCRYMPGPLTECYSRYRLENGDKQDKSLDGQIIACLAAGKGNYAGAADLFAAIASARKDDHRAAMQALLCTSLAGKTASDEMTAAAPALAAALGMRKGTLQMQDLPAVAEMTAEAGRMVGPECAADLAEKIAVQMKPELRRQFVACLDINEEFAGALRVAEHMEPDGETAFLIGYYAMQMHRPCEARLAFAAAQSMGYADPALAECRTVLGEDGGGAAYTAPAGAVAYIQQGRFDQALDLLLQAAGCPDRESCSLISVCYLQTGRPHMALLAALAGLRTAPEYSDLLVNAGDARLALHEPETAARDYEAAVRFCPDPVLKADLAAQIRRLAGARAAD